MVKLLEIIMLLATFAGLMGMASAATGYGTSKIIFSQNNYTLGAGSGANINYTVELASGNTWGTNLVVVNQNTLASQGITVSISNPSGEPPFSGYLTVSTSNSTLPGRHSIVLAATGDDPSPNATLTIVVFESAPGSGQATTVTANKTTASTSAASSQSTTINSYINSSASGTIIYCHATPSGLDICASVFSNSTFLWAAIALIAILALISLVLWKALPTRLVFVGVALILIGILVWLYGDYSGGLMSYIWSGVGAILFGTLLWVYGDFVAGAFRRGSK